MLAKAHRFHGRRSMAQAYKKSSAFRAGLLTMRISASKNGEPYRVAVVVSKKVHKSAVVRNRIRRRLYELCRETIHEGARTDVVLIVHEASVSTMPAVKLRSVVIKLLKDARVPLRVDPKHGIVNKKEIADVS